MKKCLSAFITILFTLLFIMGVLLLLSVPAGFRFYAVQTGSMSKSYPVGTLVVVRNTAFKDISVGDAITYHISEDTLVTHRVISVNKEKLLFQTKGDSNNAADQGLIAYDDVVGRVVGSVPKIGYAVLFIETTSGKVCVGILTATAVLAEIIYRMLVKKKKQ